MDFFHILRNVLVRTNTILKRHNHNVFKWYCIVSEAVGCSSYNKKQVILKLLKIYIGNLAHSLCSKR